jgi:hypothetical protein
VTTSQFTFKREVRPGDGPLRERIVYRGRCSCGYETHMHYSEPQIALGAIRRTHKDCKGAHE